MLQQSQLSFERFLVHGRHGRQLRDCGDLLHAERVDHKECVRVKVLLTRHGRKDLAWPRGQARHDTSQATFPSQGAVEGNAGYHHAMAEERGHVSAMDDYAVHQAPELLATVATTDPNFFERFYFNLYSHSDDLFMIVGLGQYPNRGLDRCLCHRRAPRGAALAAQFHRLRWRPRHHPGRSAGDRNSLREPGLSTYGPMNTKGRRSNFDLTWQADIAPYLEQRTNAKVGPRTTDDGQRFVQTGRWTGGLRLGDERFSITSDRYWGVRRTEAGVCAGWPTACRSCAFPPHRRSRRSSRGPRCSSRSTRFSTPRSRMRRGCRSVWAAHLVAALPSEAVADLGPTDHQLVFEPG